MNPEKTPTEITFNAVISIRMKEVIKIAAAILGLSLLYRFNILTDWLYGLLLGISSVILAKNAKDLIRNRRTLKMIEDGEVTPEQEDLMWDFDSIIRSIVKIREYEDALNIPEEQRFVLDGYDEKLEKKRRKKEKNNN